MHLGRRCHSTYLLSKGAGLFGATGINNGFHDVLRFTRVPISTPGQIVDISAGWGHSAVFTDRSEFFVFGRPYDFKILLHQFRIRGLHPFLGRIIAQSSYFFDKGIGLLAVPTHFKDIRSTISVRCTAGVTMILNSTGQVSVFGNNRWGQCGIKDSPNQHILEPTFISGLPERVAAIEAGGQHLLALTYTGRLYAWGKSARGQLGTGPSEVSDHSATPVHIAGLPGKVRRVSAGFNHTAVVDDVGDVYVWGKLMSLTEKKTNMPFTVYDDQFTPRRLDMPGGRKAIDVACGIASTVILAEDCTLWAIGLGEYDRKPITQPLQVLAPLPPNNPDAPDEYYVAPPSFRMSKGQARVAILTDDRQPDGTADSRFVTTSVYEVVLHELEAYLLPAQPDFDASVFSDDQPSRLSTDKKYRIKEYSAGWQHALMLLECTN
jgi:alpha-tubulin suppressor-like RCC1 family protein